MTAKQFSVRIPISVGIVNSSSVRFGDAAAAFCVLCVAVVAFVLLIPSFVCGG